MWEKTSGPNTGAINAPPAEKNDFKSKNALLANFCLMAFAFSANHATVVSLVGVAGAVLSGVPGLNGAIQATLYTVYTLSSLLFANLFISELGSKGTIVMGLCMYCFYSGAFLVSHFLTKGSTLQWVIVLLATAVSGLGAGGLWTAQASFFSSTAKQHARLTGCSIEQANAYFSSVFVVFYLGFEIIMRLISSLVDIKNASAVLTLYIIYSAVAVGGAFLMTLVRPVQGSTEAVTRVPMCKKITAAFDISLSDPRVMLLAPYNFTFSIASAFLNAYVTTQSTYTCSTDGSPSKTCTAADDEWKWLNTTHKIDHQGADIVPPSWIGYLGAGLVLSALAFSTISGWIIKNTSLPKAVPMLMGSACFIGFSLFFILNPGQEGNARMHSKYEYLIPLYIIFGCGRGVWESTMKAVFADFFGGDPATSAAAFANIPLQNGFSGAIGFIIFSQIESPRTLGMWLVAGIGVCGIVTYWVANGMTNKQLKTKGNADEKSGLISGAIAEEEEP